MQLHKGDHHGAWLSLWRALSNNSLPTGTVYYRWGVPLCPQTRSLELLKQGRVGFSTRNLPSHSSGDQRSEMEGSFRGREGERAPLFSWLWWFADHLWFPRLVEASPCLYLHLYMVFTLWACSCPNFLFYKDTSHMDEHSTLFQYDLILTNFIFKDSTSL